VTLTKVNLSQVVSKYVGETEKNLGTILNRADRIGFVLFFDEAGTLSPEAAASGIARGLSQNRALIVPGFRPGMIAWIARHCPGLFSKTSELLLGAKI
jgi:hypothetical protein